MSRSPLLLACSAVCLIAQTAAPVEFDVASIKPNNSGSGGMGINNNHGLWRGTNVSVKMLIENAYDILPDQLVGAPAWIESARYDIEAKAEDDPNLSGTEADHRMSLRLQALLATRFQFKMHRENKEWQAYSLVAGKKGPKLTPTERKAGTSVRSSNGHVEAKGISMDGLARNISVWLGRPTINQTGIEGRFDLILDFENQERAVRISNSNSPISGTDPGKPSLFTALQDQIGLKLESRKVPVEMLIVERIERPSEN